MNNQSDNERLFADALADASPADFRDRLLGRTLRLARRRRHVRQARRAGIALGIVSAFALWLWPRTTPHPQRATPTLTNYRLIETQPLPASALVVTQPFRRPIVASTAATSVITTAEVRNGLHILTDDELLSLAPGPAVLVRLSPDSAELILADQIKTTSQ